MATTITDLTPFVPSDQALVGSDLPDKALALVGASARLSGMLAPLTLERLTRYMASINSYYSNLIEGNATRPHEIRAAQRGDYAKDPVKRDLQLESLAHMQVQQWLQDEQPDLDTLFTPTYISRIHLEFYQRIPESLWAIKDEQNAVVDQVEPGQWREKPVSVGRHLPPDHGDLPALMQRFCETYHPKRHPGDRKIIAILAAHHRFAWVHPFMDGNGRVGRLFTDAALKAAGLNSYGAWCLSRGLARTSTRYKTLLANADSPRRGDIDGRGKLTEQGLMEFCRYMIDTALDQVGYISSMLDLRELRQRIEKYIEARNDNRVPGITGQLKPAVSTILFTAFQQGEIERAHALELCAIPERSGRRLLGQLKNDGLLSETSSKSPLRWEIPEHAEPWYFPGLTQ